MRRLPRRRERARHGRTAAEKANDQRNEKRRQALLDAVRRGDENWLPSD
jgi:hypothetical protein